MDINLNVDELLDDENILMGIIPQMKDIFMKMKRQSLIDTFCCFINNISFRTFIDSKHCWNRWST